MVDQPPERRGWSAILTVPNVITIVRLALIPVFVLALLRWDARGWAAVLLGFLGATDWVDGWFARRFDQVSELGKILDPTADRILLGVAVVSLMVDGSVPGWVGWVILVREVLVSAAVLALAAVGAARIDVQWVGKAGAWALMFGLPLFLLAAALGDHGHDAAADVARIAAWLFTIPGMALSWYAAAGYVPLARDALRRGRSARSLR